jgi:hypothetical protein
MPTRSVRRISGFVQTPQDLPIFLTREVGKQEVQGD